MKKMIQFSLVGAIVVTFPLVAYPLHTCLYKGYASGIFLFPTYDNTQWALVWLIGLIATIAGHVLRTRSPFLATVLLLAGGLCLVIPTIGRCNNPQEASPKLTLGLINLAYFMVCAARFPGNKESSNIGNDEPF